MKRILVGLDGSAHEQEVLRQAALLAQKLDGKLILFRAVALPIGLPPEALTISPLVLEQKLVADARAHLDDIARTLPPSLVERAQVEEGVPWRAVCDAAAGCDLIVIGSHGYGGIDRLVGTTAAKIVNHAHCSVLVVRSSVA